VDRGLAPQEVKAEVEMAGAGGQGVMGPADLSARIGQLLYSMALEAGVNGCSCAVCGMARELAKVLAAQLRAGPPTLRGGIP